MNIRAAAIDDVEAVLEFWRAAAARHSLVDEAAGVERLIRRDPEALLIADIDGAIAGTLVVGWDGWRCHLYRLAVDSSRRRQGVARALLRAAAERAVALGACRFDAVVMNENDDGEGFWRAEGFTHDDDTGRWTKLL